MSGCLRSVGCLTLLCLLAVAGWITRARWMPAVTGTHSAPTIAFDPATEARRERGQNAITSLGQKSGPFFANLTAAEASALVLTDAKRRLPAFVGNVEAAIVGDRLVLRSEIDPAELNALDKLGPLASKLQSRQQVTLAGTLDVASPGHAEYIVQELHVNDLDVPSPIIAALVRQIDRRSRAGGTSDRAIGFDVPPYVGDIRVGKGRVTLYKSVQ